MRDISFCPMYLSFKMICLNVFMKELQCETVSRRSTDMQMADNFPSPKALSQHDTR